MNNSMKKKYCDIYWDYTINTKKSSTVLKQNKKYKSFKNDDKLTFNNNSNIEVRDILRNTTGFYYGILFFLLCIFLLFLSITVSKADTLDLNSEFCLPNDTDSGIEAINKMVFSTESTNKQDKVLKENYNYKKIGYSKYRIKNNDTIGSISKKFGISVESIALCNNVKTANGIKAGEIILIPNQNGRNIVVNQNDSIYKIANRYGISWKMIADCNALTSQTINQGMRLFIPEAGMSRMEKFKFYAKPEKKNVVKKVNSDKTKKKVNVDNNIISWPMKGKITSYFGMRLDPFKKIYIFHSGIDIKGNIGDPVACAGAGIVAYTGWTNIFGNFIIIKHTDKLVTLYGHLDSIDVKKGDKVESGVIIGKVGNTGRSTGPHLHFEVRKNNVPVDPLKILNQRKGL